MVGKWEGRSDAGGGGEGVRGLLCLSYFPQALVLQVLHDAHPEGAAPTSCWMAERSGRAQVVLGGARGCRASFASPWHSGWFSGCWMMAPNWQVPGRDFCRAVPCLLFPLPSLFPFPFPFLDMKPAHPHDTSATSAHPSGPIQAPPGPTCAPSGCPKPLHDISTFFRVIPGLDRGLAGNL